MSESLTDATLPSADPATDPAIPEEPVRVRISGGGYHPDLGIPGLFLGQGTFEALRYPDGHLELVGVTLPGADVLGVAGAQPDALAEAPDNASTTVSTASRTASSDADDESAAAPAANDVPDAPTASPDGAEEVASATLPDAAEEPPDVPLSASGDEEDAAHAADQGDDADEDEAADAASEPEELDELASESPESAAPDSPEND